MTKTSSNKNYFFRPRGILSLSLAVLFSLQPSAEAFIGSLQISSASNVQSGTVQPSAEMNSISDASLLKSALSPINHTSSEIRTVFPSASNSAVSISTYQNRYRKFARFIFAADANSGERRYQAYELNQNNILGRVIETGSFAGGQFIRERIYDYKSGTVTLYNPKNVFEKRIYELREFGEPGRPVQYRGRNQSGDLINIRFFYQKDKVTCVHMKNMTFSTYQFVSGVLGRLLEVGTARAVSKEGQLESIHLISISEIEHKNEIVPVYVFHEEGGIQITRERIGGTLYTLGAMGRVLRFVSPDADLEYFYEEASSGSAAKVKVLNHLIGESLTFEVAGKVLNEDSGRLAPSKDSFRTPLIKAVSASFPLFFKDSVGAFWTPSESGTLPIYIRLNDEVLIWEKLLRGPPVSKRDQFDSFLCYFVFLPFFNSSVLSGVQS